MKIRYIIDQEDLYLRHSDLLLAFYEIMKRKKNIEVSKIISMFEIWAKKQDCKVEL